MIEEKKSDLHAAAASKAHQKKNENGRDYNFR
jgi:hypothetical protein